MVSLPRATSAAECRAAPYGAGRGCQAIVRVPIGTLGDTPCRMSRMQLNLYCGANMRKILWLFTWIVLAGASQACERIQPVVPQVGRSMMIRQRDPNYRLAPNLRAQLVRDIDGDAVEELLQYTAPQDRPTVLSMFSRPEPGQSWRAQIVAPGSDDPIVKDLLERIWAPTWEALGPEQIETADLALPGRELARKRLALRKKPSSSKQ
jgi:hypothetical protein